MKKTTIHSWTQLLALPFLMIAATAQADVSPGLQKMPPTVGVMGKTLQLNGAGLRTATLFKVKVYEGGLYLPHRSSDPQQIVNSADPKAVRLNFLREVTQSQAQDAWKEGFQKNCHTDCQALQSTFNQFVSKVPGAKTGDVFVYLFTPQSVNLIQNGNEIAKISDPKIVSRLSKIMLSTWLGENAVSPELKQALLGITSNNGAVS